MIVPFKNIAKVVVVVVVLVIFSICVITAKKFECSKIAFDRREEQSYLNFTLKIPYSSKTAVIVTKVHLSGTPESIGYFELSIIAKSLEEVRAVFREDETVPYVLTFNSTLPRPKLLRIEIGTEKHCILYCDGGLDFRTGVKHYVLRKETIFDPTLISAYPDCIDYKPCFSPLPENCGKTNVRRRDDTSELERGSWPWLVPIFVQNRKGLTFKCGGNIIGRQTILTAAHCFLSKNGSVYSANQIIIFTGRHNLVNFNEKGFVAHGAKEIIIHPGYQRTYRHDIALINLETEIVFTNFTQPVCLWSYSTAVGSVVGRDGLVAGWGRKTDGKVTPVPHILQQRIVDSYVCKQSSQFYKEQDLNLTICGIGWDGTLPCQGDSGGGLILAENDQRYSVRGLVSTTLGEYEESGCGLSNYIVYTDVAKYYNWIRSEMT